MKQVNRFPTVRIEGSIFTHDILEEVAAGGCMGQDPKGFNLSKGKVKDEISRAWADAQAQWPIFKRQQEQVELGKPGTDKTRSFWMIPLLSLLGYDIRFSAKAEIIDDRTYNISHKAENLGEFPVMIMGFNDSLDKKRESGGPRMSPHGLVQEYLNLTEHLYALVTNGFQLRLLRDSSRLIQLSYLEFDLKSMMEDEHFSDFALMYRLLHATRMPNHREAGPDSLIENYHQDSLDSGTRIRKDLSKAVESAIITLANGFLQNNRNSDLHEKLKNKELGGGDFYLLMLRLIYRLLFLMVVEERHLIYDKNADKEHRNIYYTYYSVSQLRKRSESAQVANPTFCDLWVGLTGTFHLFEEGEKGAMLSIEPLSGHLFASGALKPLVNCYLENGSLLKAIKSLSLFENRLTGQKVRVNYGSLNVEEFGSVYEGLLEYEPVIQLENGCWNFHFCKGSERSISGSHYTPEELVQPLIRHSLEHVIKEKLKGADSIEKKVSALLSVRVCDATCGSGHILLSAARRIGIEVARVQTNEEQPAPTAVRQGVRDAIANCIYGVDKNPLAVELCKVALWLEAHNPGKPLDFLDHHIKCGDAIVGLAHMEELDKGIPDEAFKKNPDDDPQVVKEYRKINSTQRRENLRLLGESKSITDAIANLQNKFKRLNAMPRGSVKANTDREEEYRAIIESQDWRRVKMLADMQTAQFFISKKEENIASLVTHSQFSAYMKGTIALEERVFCIFQQLAGERRFFHWFLEFPDIFAAGGFDCILGNPPYLGGQAISGTYGDNYLNYITSVYAPASGCDLVTYFLRRVFTIIKKRGFNGLITTNSISEGRMRESGLGVILKENASLNFAHKSIRWPGEAKLFVSLLTIFKGQWMSQRFLDQKPVEYISTFFDDLEGFEEVFELEQNKNQIFQGSIFLGDGFLLSPGEKDQLINLNPKNRDVIFPVINGKNLNGNHTQMSERYIINFFDWSQEKALQYSEPFRIIKEKVKPIRDKTKREANRKRWWIYAEHRPGLYKAISKLKRCFAVARTTKYLNFSAISVDIVFTEALFIYADEKFSNFAILQSSHHNQWARKFSSTLETRLRYAPSDCFETFPFPQGMSQEMETELEQVGEEYHEFRRRLMLKLELGLTKTYNLFHQEDLTVAAVQKACKKDESVSQSAYQDILHLREFHKQLDEAVLRAYGWADIALEHGFYQMEYLPENDRVRFTISPVARKEILKRLLELNHTLHQQEIEAQAQATDRTDEKKKRKIKQANQDPVLESEPIQRSFDF